MWGRVWYRSSDRIELLAVCVQLLFNGTGIDYGGLAQTTAVLYAVGHYTLQPADVFSSYYSIQHQTVYFNA